MGMWAGYRGVWGWACHTGEMSEAEQVDRGALLALMQASQAVADGEDAIGVCRLLAERAAAVLAAEGASVLLLDAAGKQLRFEVVTGPGEGIVEGMAFDAAEGIAGQVTRTGRAVRIDDVGQNGNFFPDVDQRTKARTRSLMAAPLSQRGRVIGVVEVINPTDQPRFTDRDLELFRVFANLTAAAAANTCRKLTPSVRRGSANSSICWAKRSRCRASAAAARVRCTKPSSLAPPPEASNDDSWPSGS